MSIRFLTRHHCCSLPIMFSRCVSSIYRSLGQNVSFFSRKKYSLLTNTVLANNNTKWILSNIIREVSSIFGLSLFLFYLFYQLFGNFIFIIFIICGILCKYFLTFRNINQS
jgi:hypothetical protein